MERASWYLMYVQIFFIWHMQGILFYEGLLDSVGMTRIILFNLQFNVIFSDFMVGFTILVLQLLIFWIGDFNLVSEMALSAFAILLNMQISYLTMIQAKRLQIMSKEE